MEFKDGPEVAEARAWRAKLSELHARVGRILAPEEDPFILHADCDRGSVRFVLVHGTPDTTPAPDNPMISESLADNARFAEAMANIANYTVQQLYDAWSYLDHQLLEAITGSSNILPTFDQAIAKMQSFFAGDSIEVSEMMMELQTVEFIGDNFDGHTLDKIMWRTPAQLAQLFVLARNGQPYAGWINNQGQHPIAQECMALFGPTKDLTDLVDGRFKDVEELESTLLAVAVRTEGFLPEGQVAALLARVRDVALEARERRPLTCIRPSLKELDEFINILG